MPAPDVAVVLHLDEEVRQDRLLGRGEVTTADRETLDPVFRDRVTAELTGLAVKRWANVVIVDVTGADRAEAVRRVLRGIAR